MPLPHLNTDDVDYMREQFEAWMAGARSRARGLTMQAIPHPPRTRKGDAWENGWETIDQECRDRGEEAANSRRIQEFIDARHDSQPEVIKRQELACVAQLESWMTSIGLPAAMAVMAVGIALASPKKG